jgi:hypothetical protein
MQDAVRRQEHERSQLTNFIRYCKRHYKERKSKIDIRLFDMGVIMKRIVWDMPLCRQRPCCLLLECEGGGSMFLRNVGELLPRK